MQVFSSECMYPCTPLQHSQISSCSDRLLTPFELQIFGDMLSPLPKPDTVPMHPVRDILERCNKAGLAFKFEPATCSQDGCTALIANVEGVPLGK